MLHELHRLPLCPYIRLHHQFIGKMIVSVQIYAHKRKGGGGGVLIYCTQTYSHMYTHLQRHVTGIILLWRETGWEALTASKS